MNISPDLVPFFERIKRSVRATPRMSRTEAFLKYAEEHPSELLVDVDAQTDALIREFESRLG